MVDAAICIPVYLIALAMMLQVINFAGIEERKYYDAINRIHTVGLFGSDIELGSDIKDESCGLSIDHVQSYPMIYKISFPFAGAFFKSKTVVMDMPFRTYIGESTDISDEEYVYIFPKNEGNEKGSPKYHDCYCRTMKGGSTRGLSTERVKLSEAVSRGYTRCEWCSREGSK